MLSQTPSGLRTLSPGFGRGFEPILAAVLAPLLAVVWLSAPVQAETKFKRIPTQFIAALGDPGATSGSGAQSWGVWRVDPGPRGVRLENYAQLQAARGVAPAQWTFDTTDWWLEEHGLIMEKPDFPLPAGQYLVTGDREVTAVLTIEAKDKDGAQRWSLDKGATLYDVTHLPCRSARYASSGKDNVCSPSAAKQSEFPVQPGAAMPAVNGCTKQDYAVLFVIGVAEE
jgi:hypothetical protein